MKIRWDRVNNIDDLKELEYLLLQAVCYGRRITQQAIDPRETSVINLIERNLDKLEKYTEVVY